MPVWSKLQRAARGSSEERHKSTPTTGAAPATHSGPSLNHTYTDSTAPLPAHAPKNLNNKTARLHEWLKTLTLTSGIDSLTTFKPELPGFIDLNQAHPSGLAQLFAGRPTRVSALIRDSHQAGKALRDARLLRAKTHELAREYGIDSCYLAAGTIQWAGQEPVTAPVLLTPATLQTRTGHNDYEVHLTGAPLINPALVRALKRVHRLAIDPRSLSVKAFSVTRFDPAPVLEQLRALTSAIPGLTVDAGLIVGSFADLSHTLQDPPTVAGSGLVPHLCFAAEHLASGKTADPPQKLGPKDFPALDSRHPDEEFLVLDADPSQQVVIDAVNAGHSLAVHTPAGTGQTQTALNVIASLAFQGKSVLVLSHRRATMNEITQRFQELSLQAALLPLTTRTSADELKSRLVQAIIRNEQAQEPQLAGLHETVTSHRTQLVEHMASLHTVRPRWGASPYQAMQALAQLTSLNPAPATTVRLKRSVLNAIRDRSEVAAKLARAAQLGSFSRAAASSPWHGAHLVTRKETAEAHALVTELAQELPAFREKMDGVAAFSHIHQGATFHEWGQQLELLVAIRESLDKFTPDIFDQPVTDLIAATASVAWRRENNIDITAMQRSRLRRVAREYIRPGVHIDDLHQALQLVQHQRQWWAEQATSQRHPVVPSGLAGLAEQYSHLESRLRDLAPALEHTAAGNDLVGAPVESLIARLQVLAADRQTLDVLPERSVLEEQLREYGLQELLDDLAQRQVPESLTAAELDLAWWQSVLEAMVSGDDYLAMADGSALRALVAEFQLADSAHIASGPSRLRWKLAQLWGEALRAHPQAVQTLKTMLTGGRFDLATIDSQCASLLHPLVPVWALSPFLVPSVIPPGRHFDAVVILDAESLAVPAALAALARTSQVVAFGDPTLPAPQSFSVVPEARTSASAPSSEQMSVLEALGQVLPVQTLTRVYRCVDEQLSQQLSEDFYDGQLTIMPRARSLIQRERSIVVEYLPDGTGNPGATGEVEAVPAEVARAVDEVFVTVRAHPRSSLAVVTASAVHAARVAEGIRLHLHNYPQLREYFQSAVEPFQVLTLDRLAGVVRDRIIFSLGFGRTPHGRALHDFGLLSQPGGRGRFLAAMTRARQQITVFSCLRPEELDCGKLSHGAVDFYRLLEREFLQETSGNGAPVSVGAPEGASLSSDSLVADLAQRLANRGARLWFDVGNVVDVAVAADPVRTLTAPWEKGIAPVALEADGSSRCLSMSVRERHRLRPQLLAACGWQVMNVWGIEVFADPAAVATRVAEKAQLPTLPESGVTTPPTAETSPSQAGGGLTVGQSPLAARAQEDDPRLWGEWAENGHTERWYRDQRPPHWG